MESGAGPHMLTPGMNSCHYLCGLEQRCQTPLYIATGMGHAAVVEKLLAAGADMNKADQVSRVLLCSALQQLHSFCLHEVKQLSSPSTYISTAWSGLVHVINLELLGDLSFLHTVSVW